MIPTWANMLAVLKKIRTEAATGDCGCVLGICAAARWQMVDLLHVGDYGNDSYECRDHCDSMIARLFREVGYDPVYPIFDDTNEDYASPMAQYDYLPHWEGRQLELRIELLDKCINYLEAGNEPVV